VGLTVLFSPTRGGSFKGSNPSRVSARRTTGELSIPVRNDDRTGGHPPFDMRSVWVAAENLPPIVLAMV